MEKTLTEIGIKYNVKKITDTMYILIPVEVVEGYSVGEFFYNSAIHFTLYNVNSLEASDVIASIRTVEELKDFYQYDEIEFIKDFYLTEEKDYFLTVEVKDGKLIQRKVNMTDFCRVEGKETYERQKDAPAVTLNCDALEELMNSSDLRSIKEKLDKYHRLVKEYRDREVSTPLTSITVKNGRVAEIGLNRTVADSARGTNSNGGGRIVLPQDVSDISVVGLERYLRERVFGHDDEIRKIATRMIMNYRSTPEFGTESILIVGPTGTGKTETIKAASEYLGLPFIPVNTANLVPQGIKGSSLEDYLYAMLVACGHDMKKAEKGLMFLDEFDKIGRDSLDIKETVKQILLKFIEGDTFMIDKLSGDYSFNTRMLNKVFAGAFQELFDKKKTPLGFGAPVQSSEFQFNPAKITEGEYFGKELVTRIEHIFVYDPLTREDQKKVMLHSKLSKLLAKKRRYELEFGVELIALDDYVEAVLDKLNKEDKSMRDLNNIILSTLDDVEYQLLANEGKVKKLILTADTVADPKSIILK